MARLAADTQQDTSPCRGNTDGNVHGPPAHRQPLHQPIHLNAQHYQL
jgi:hypothetical protein